MIYKIQVPLGTTVVPNEEMTEEELRKYAMQIAESSPEGEIWKEKAEKDPIEDVVTWLTQLGFIITKP